MTMTAQKDLRPTPGNCEALSVKTPGTNRSWWWPGGIEKILIGVVVASLCVVISLYTALAIVNMSAKDNGKSQDSSCSC